MEKQLHLSEGNGPLPLLQRLGLPTCVVGKDGRLTQWNTQVSDFFGVPAEAALGREWHAVVRTVQAEGCCALCQTRRSLSNGEPAYPVTTVLSAAGSHRSAVLVPIAMNTGDDDALGFLILASGAERGAEPGNHTSIPLRGRVQQLDHDRIIVALTARERQILECIVAGLDARRTAEHLGITHATARNYVQRILNKLGVRNKAEAVSIALTYNLLAS